ncbi:hypothetical protein ACJMK2_026610, partial [Sinanodonta woodiana]
AIKCLSCSTVARPQNKCSVQLILTAAGYTTYSVGCTDIHMCASFVGKGAILNATDLQEIQQKNEFGAIPDEQWEQGTKDALLCAECCDTQLCNACYFAMKIIGADFVYKSSCILRQHCQQIGHLNPGANVLIGRRQRDVDMLSIKKRASFCNKCCTGNICNFGNCSSLVHPTNTLTPLTQPTSTLSSLTHLNTTQAVLTPVIGGWNAWSSWNQCSVTCGQGSHYRLRICNNPHPANGGATCSGSSSETQLCTQQVCSVDGQWSLWTMWSICSKTCGTGGTRFRQRTCDNPPPSVGGKDCAQSPYQSQDCDGLVVPNVIQTTINFTKPDGSNIAMQCLVPGSTPLQQNSRIQWMAPQAVGKPFPPNVFQEDDGSLVIIGLSIENTGPYFCQIITPCGTYNSARFYVNSQ